MIEQHVYMINVKSHENPTSLSKVFKQKYTHGINAIFQYPYIIYQLLQMLSNHLHVCNITFTHKL